LKGRTNGELLREAERAGYDVLLTIDQGIPHQQKIAGRKLAIVVISSRTYQLGLTASCRGYPKCSANDNARSGRANRTRVNGLRKSPLKHGDSRDARCARRDTLSGIFASDPA
jgi:hypothetical protein